MMMYTWISLVKSFNALYDSVDLDSVLIYITSHAIKTRILVSVENHWSWSDVGNAGRDKFL